MFLWNLYDLFDLFRSDGSITRGKKYELLDNIRDAMSDGRFCAEVTAVLFIMKENKLRQAIAEHIKKATMRNSQSIKNVEPQSATFERLIVSVQPVENDDDETFHPHLDQSQNDETRAKVVQ